MTKRLLLLCFTLVAFTGMGLAWYLFKAVYGDNVVLESESTIITIYPGQGFPDVQQMLVDSGYLKNIFTFQQVAKLMKYNKELVPDGKYKIYNGWSNRELIGLLRSGMQVSIDVTYNNVRTIEELCGQLSRYFVSDSIAICEAILDSALLASQNLTKENVISIFIPNTYKMYWNTPPASIVNRLISERDKFWAGNGRKVKANSLNMTIEEIYTLASIVEKESNYIPERPTIAGVYINRLERGIPLQADPTVVFATGDFSIRRVLNKHLETDSPFNTYKYAGLPPGPIAMPSINSIDAVLNAEKHNYLFFCAKPGYDNQHAFAETLRQHNVNANIYRAWLSSEKIK